MTGPDPNDAHNLAERVTRTRALDLFPASKEFQGTRVRGSLTLIAAHRLADGQWLTVLREESGRLIGAPVTTAGDGVRRLSAGDGGAAALVTTICHGNLLGGDGFHAMVVSPATLEASVERPMLVDQTHESVVVADQAVVKWAVAAEPTPAPTLSAHLAAAGFRDMPQPWGFVTWQRETEPVLLASVTSFLPGASDGWSWAVADAASYCAHEGSLAESVAPMEQVGELVADLHCALATSTPVIPVTQTVADAAQRKEWRNVALGLLAAAVAEVDGAEGRRLQARAPAVSKVIEQLARIERTPVIPVHGDLHIGQVLRWVGGYAVNDFDGNPVLPAEQRLRPQPAARDVAGMVQSLDHVGRVVQRRVEGAEAKRVAEWIERAQQEFLQAYRGRLTARGHSALLDERLLMPFRVEQECREFLYAVRHLPRWRYVPDQALRALFPTS